MEQLIMLGLIVAVFYFSFKNINWKVKGKPNFNENVKSRDNIEPHWIWIYGKNEIGGLFLVIMTIVWFVNRNEIIFFARLTDGFIDFILKLPNILKSINQKYFWLTVSAVYILIIENSIRKYFRTKKDKFNITDFIDLIFYLILFSSYILFARDIF